MDFFAGTLPLHPLNPVSSDICLLLDFRIARNLAVSQVIAKRKKYYSSSQENK